MIREVLRFNIKVSTIVKQLSRANHIIDKAFTVICGTCIVSIRITMQSAVNYVYIMSTPTMAYTMSHKDMLCRIETYS